MPAGKFQDHLSEFKVENVFTLERLERSDLDSILTCQAKNSNVTTSSDCSTLTVLLLLGQRFT